MLVTAVTVVACGAWLAVRSPAYETTAQLLVSPLPQDDTTFIGIQVLRESPEPTRTMQTAASLISSRTAAQLTAARLGAGWDTTEVEDAVAVKPQGESNILAVTARTDSPTKAAPRRQRLRRRRARQRRRDLQRQVGAAVREARLQIRGANRPATPSPGHRPAPAASCGWCRAGSTRRSRVSQPASLSTDPVGPPNWLIIVLAVVAGFTLASVAAVLAEALVAGRDAPARVE